MLVAIEELEAVARRVTRSFGYTEEEAESILEVLMYAQLRRNNQGVVKLVEPGIPKDPRSSPMIVDRRSACVGLLHANLNHAMLALRRAVDESISFARESGVGVVGVQGINTSSGALGFYTRRLAEQGMIGIVMAGASPVVAPAGSYERLLGTNPISIAVPSDSSPVVLDLATAAMAFFGVIEAKTAGRTLPDGVAYDRDGSPTTDPGEALQGALRTFDGTYKSSGLSFMVQALTGPLVGASFFGLNDVQDNWGGHLVIALSPKVLAGEGAFEQGVSRMVSMYRDAKRLPDVEEILLPGERGDRLTEAARTRAEVEIEDNLYQRLLGADIGQE